MFTGSSLLILFLKLVIVVVAREDITLVYVQPKFTYFTVAWLLRGVVMNREERDAVV